MLTYGFEGAIRIASAAVDRLEHARRGVRLALEADAVDLVAVAAGDEPLLEGEAPRGRVEPGSEPIVGGRQDRRLDPESPREPGRDGGERLAGAQRLRPDEVEAEIAVAEPEPVLAAERRDRAERLPGLAGPAPASLLVVQAGEGVEDAVEIGRDRHPEHLEVVADVADDGEIRAARHVDEAAGEARSADAAGEEDDLHGWKTRPIAACVLGPARRPTRRRSSIVSTSSPRFGIAHAIAGTPMLSACSRKRAALPPP